MSRSGTMLGRSVAAVLLVATLPAWIVLASVVRASVGRPIFFRQVRSGLAGRPFTICKFRTMRDTRGADGQLLPDACRETPATRRMRSWRLDELPQLLSIARGEMAFVGPRPLLPATIAGFGELGLVRCRVRPGLTGWSQVNGNTRLADREKLALDLWYIHNRSLALDLAIVLRTAAVLVRGERIVEGNLASAAAAMRRADAAVPGSSQS